MACHATVIQQVLWQLPWSAQASELNSSSSTLVSFALARQGRLALAHWRNHYVHIATDLTGNRNTHCGALS
jgi:hypothetical protein